MSVQQELIAQPSQAFQPLALRACTKAKPGKVHARAAMPANTHSQAPLNVSTVLKEATVPPRIQFLFLAALGLTQMMKIKVNVLCAIRVMSAASKVRIRKLISVLKGTIAHMEAENLRSSPVLRVNMDPKKERSMKPMVVQNVQKVTSARLMEWSCLYSVLRAATA